MIAGINWQLPKRDYLGEPRVQFVPNLLINNHMADKWYPVCFSTIADIAITTHNA
jgi:hypothetical protein